MESPEETANASMIKVDPKGISVGNFWDEQGRTEIVQIFVSHDDICIRSLQFQYFEDGNLVLSARHGLNVGSKFDPVMLNYPSEYVTCVSGLTTRSGLNSITFTTNLNVYGPFGRLKNNNGSDEFRFHLGKDKQFGGFYGYAHNYITSIGVYLKPISTLNIQQNQKQNGSPVEEAEEVQIQQQL